MATQQIPTDGGKKPTSTRVNQQAIIRILNFTCWSDDNDDGDGVTM